MIDLRLDFLIFLYKIKYRTPYKFNKICDIQKEIVMLVRMRRLELP